MLPQFSTVQIFEGLPSNKARIVCLPFLHEAFSRFVCCRITFQ